MRTNSLEAFTSWDTFRTPKSRGPTPSHPTSWQLSIPVSPQRGGAPAHPAAQDGTRVSHGLSCSWGAQQPCPGKEDLPAAEGVSLVLGVWAVQKSCCWGPCPSSAHSEVTCHPQGPHLPSAGTGHFHITEEGQVHHRRVSWPGCLLCTTRTRGWHWASVLLHVHHSLQGTRGRSWEGPRAPVRVLLGGVVREAHTCQQALRYPGW